MKRPPLFSVIICTYNRAALLPRALESLLAQTAQTSSDTGLEGSDWEAIIVDDGSTDATRYVIEQYLRHANIRAVWHANRGTGASRTRGLEESCGVYATFLDSDDEYLPTHLASRKALLLASPEIDLLHGGLEIIGNPYVADKDDPARLVHLSECVAGGTFFIRREAALKLGGFGALRYADDAAFFAKAQQAGLHIHHTDTPTYRYYRTTEDSLCTTAYEAATMKESH